MTQEQESPKPTPIELNRHLRQLFGLLPRQNMEDLLSETDQIDKRMANRRENAFAKKLIENLRSLVTQAPITDSFRKRIIENFTTYQSIGIVSEQEPEIINRDFSFLENIDPDDGGIFEPTKAKFLERTAFLRQVGMDLQTHKINTRLSEKFKSMGEYDFVRAFEYADESERQVRERWKVEFLEHYGEQIVPS